MKLRMYKTNDGINVINKTLTDMTEINIVLKGDFNIRSPVFYLSNIDWVTVDNYNYFEILEMERFYNVISVESVNSTITKFMCECDLLETYRADILASNAIYQRKIKDGDYYDVNVSFGVKPIVTTFESNVTLLDESDLIMSTVGGE